MTNARRAYRRPTGDGLLGWRPWRARGHLRPLLGWRTARRGSRGSRVRRPADRHAFPANACRHDRGGSAKCSCHDDEACDRRTAGNCKAQGYMYSTGLDVLYRATCTAQGYMYSTRLHVQHRATCTAQSYMYGTELHVRHRATCTAQSYIYSTGLHVQHSATCTA